MGIAAVNRDDPQYVIKSDKTDHVAPHKGRALGHLPRKRRLPLGPI